MSQCSREVDTHTSHSPTHPLTHPRTPSLPPSPAVVPHPPRQGVGCRKRWPSAPSPLCLRPNPTTRKTVRLSFPTHPPTLSFYLPTHPPYLLNLDEWMQATPKKKLFPTQPTHPPTHPRLTGTDYWMDEKTIAAEARKKAAKRKVRKKRRAFLTHPPIYTGQHLIQTTSFPPTHPPTHPSIHSVQHLIPTACSSSTHQTTQPPTHPPTARFPRPIPRRQNPPGDCVSLQKQLDPLHFHHHFLHCVFCLSFPRRAADSFHSHS